MNILIISGFDATASAGILLDSHIVKTLNLQPFAIVPSLLVQNHSGIFGNIVFQKDEIANQINNIPFQAKFVKIGLLQTIQAVKTVGKFLAKHKPIAVVDIPLVSSSGFVLVEKMEEYIATFKTHILPFTHIFTPNQFELEAFGGINEIFSHKCKHILAKGGHSQNAQFSIDTLHHPTRKVEFSLPRISFDDNIRGTGCALSTSIACFLAQNFSVESSIEKAKNFVHNGIVHSVKVNEKTRVLRF
jgi:hydroxymethylpyrimidine/phosphomethylpyrimidine kinase